MELLVILFIVLIILCIYHVHSIQFKTRKLPPGPFMFPLGIGIIPAGLYYDPSLLITQRPWETLHKLRKYFGDFFMGEVGGFPTLVISSYEILNEISNLDEYSHKASHKLWTYPRTFNKELGLLSVTDHKIWIEMRKFTQRTLREFGFGKRHTMQSAIEAETTEIIKNFKAAIQNNNGIVHIRTNFALSVLNVLWCMVAGQRYEHDDPKLVGLLERTVNYTKSTTLTDPFHAAFKWVDDIFPGIFKEGFRLSVFDECHKFTLSLINERKEKGCYRTQPENYIDVFLQKIEDEATDKNSVYTGEQLQSMLADLITAGSTTTNGTLNYGLLFLTLNPEIQKRCQKEIDSVVSRHLTPTMDDIEKMPYFRAFILETHRLGNVVPNPIPRMLPKDWNFRGYRIPKGTIILANHYSVHMDEKYWQDPNVFRPERFIDHDGKFVNDKHVVHFGFGKRLCIGITLADSIISIFLATLLQNFEFQTIPGTKLPSMEPEIGFVLSPRPFSVKVSIRN